MSDTAAARPSRSVSPLTKVPDALARPREAGAETKPAETAKTAKTAKAKPQTRADKARTGDSYFPPRDSAVVVAPQHIAFDETSGSSHSTQSTTHSAPQSAARDSPPRSPAAGSPGLLGLDRISSADQAASLSRKSSAASVMFRPVADPRLPQGRPKSLRIHSPEAPARFRQHVAFDNIPVGEPTKHNTLSYTLSISHKGYHPRRRSRTMMVGLDENAYSDVALQWLLDEYADDGDEVICVHVTDKDARAVEERNYKALADSLVERIKAKIPVNCAISIKLEYAVGKLHLTFQHLIHVYEPSMLVVGTRGRSLGGIHGLVTKNSFSKYCLQYSPIPTVVVRDYEKRKRKKDKRSNDPTRQSYAAMLAATNGRHEADADVNSAYEIEARISPDEEAHRVAAAIGLPAAFDPTLKPIDLDQLKGRRSRPGSRPGTPPLLQTSFDAPKPTASAPPSAPASVESDEEDSVEDDDAEFGAVSGEQALKIAQAAKEEEEKQRKRLHLMEMGEAAALKHNVSSDDDSDDDDTPGSGGAKT